MVHGWTEEWVKYLDYISKIDISHDAPYRQRLRYNSTICMRSVDSNNKQAGPLCQRPDCKTSADVLVSLRRTQGKFVPHIPMHLTTRQNNTSDPAVQQQLERLSFNWKTYFSSSSSSTWTESPTWWSSSYGKNGTLKGGKTTNGEISDNNDNARVTLRLVQGNLYGQRKRSQLLSSSLESRLHLLSCALLMFCLLLSGSFASRQWRLP